MLSSWCEKDICANAALHKQGTRSDWKSDMLGSKPLTMCCYNNTGISKGTSLLDIPQFPKIGTLLCFPKPTRQVSKSWHTLDGVFPKNKGKSKSVPVTNRFNEFINSWWQS